MRTVWKPVHIYKGLFCLLREADKKRGPFCSLLLRGGLVTPTPPLVVLWESEILGPYFNAVVDAIGLQTDFTLETNRKRMKEKLLKST